MAKADKTWAIIIPLVPIALFISAVQQRVSFSPFVDGKGNISLPSDFILTFVHLGTWVLTSQPAPPGTALSQTSHTPGIHGAYTSPGSLKAYKKTGRWPDGTVIVQDARLVMWDDTPAGHQMYSGDNTEWFVMIRDARGRFKGNPSWGDGWGWALFKPGNSRKNISTDYKNDCLSCHEVAKDTDFVFVQGYPTLQQK